MMKKMFLMLLALASVVTVGAQTSSARAQENLQQQGPHSEWLPSFSGIDVDAYIDLTLVQVPESQAPKIVYDTKGSYTTKFKAEVVDHVLYITEKDDPRRPDKTSVTVYYNHADNIRLVDAQTIFREKMSEQKLDLMISGQATFTAEMDVYDLRLDLSGHSLASLSGKVRYMDVAAANGSVNAYGLEVMAILADIRGGAKLNVHVTDRLQATTVTSGSISYKGNPVVVREEVKFRGGQINRVD